MMILCSGYVSKSISARPQRKRVCEGYSMSVSVRGPSLYRMRCCATQTTVFYENGWGLFCLLKYWGEYQYIPLRPGNLSQTAANMIFSVTVGNEQTPLCLGRQMKMDQICPTAEHLYECSHHIQKWAIGKSSLEFGLNYIKKKIDR